jgi:pimeloyl-ACP methyl ester carboxylesterase
VVAACEADAGCAGAFPKLSSDVTALVADLRANPRRVDQFKLPVGTAPFVFRVARLLYQMMYFRDNNGIPELPVGLESKSALEADYSPTYNLVVEGGMDTYSLSTWGLWEVFPQNSNDTDGTFALGAHLSAVCSDEAPFTDPQRLAAAEAVPLFGPLLAHNADLDACAVWKVNASPANANEAVHGDVPTLVLAGDLDTLSSPAWADSFKEGLTAVTVVHFTTSGTQPTSGPDTTAYTCARQVRDAFLDNPTATLDLSCVATSHGPSFVLP